MKNIKVFIVTINTILRMKGARVLAAGGLSSKDLTAQINLASLRIQNGHVDKISFHGSSWHNFQYNY